MTATVLVVGAGPTGLLAAILLKKLGVDCRIIDQNAGLVQTSNALALQARTLEIFDDLGFAQQVIAQGIKIEELVMHANKEQLVRVELKQLPTNFPFILGFPQHDVEAQLSKQLEALGVQVERNKKLTQLTQDKDSFSAVISDGANTENMTGQWLIACDGYHSAVRDLVQADYLGSDLQEHFMMMDVPITWSLPPDQGNVFFHPDGVLVILPMPGKVRILAEISHDPEFKTLREPNLDFFKRVCERRCEVPIQLGEPVWLSSFWIHNRITTDYRHGRIFLAGDAAHAHSPAGGQGMNTGLQDVHNLIWKLVAVMQKKLPDKLLDTYTTERRPVAKLVIRTSSLLTMNASFKNTILMRVRDVAMKTVQKISLIKEKVALSLSQLNISYTHKCEQDGKEKTVIIKKAKKFNTGYKFCLVISPTATDAKEADNVLAQMQCKDMFTVHYLSPEDVKNFPPNENFYVVRPDQFIAHACKTAPELKKYLESVFAEK